MPTVSVIVPNYNHARYLRKRMESILAQTFQDFELILLDDASTDESQEILSLYAGDSRVRVEFNRENSGSTFKQWNKGVRMARGAYIWIAESDDYADPRLLNRLVSILEKQPEATFAYCRSFEIREDDQVHDFADSYLGRCDADHWKADFFVDGTEECRRFFVLTNPVCNASAVVFRRSAYERAGEADERLRMCGDYKLWALMALAGKVAYVAEPLNYFRTHRENVRTRAEAGAVDLAEYFSVMLWVLTHVAQPGTLPKRASEVFRRPANELAPDERIRATIEALGFIADWNYRYNPHVPSYALRAHFEEWRLALYEREFAVLPPSRWRFFLYKWDFYGHYFPEMSWKLRAVNLLRLIGATALGYQRRHEAKRALAQVTQFLEVLREK